MPRPIQRRENLANHPSLWLAATLEYGNIRNEQKLFNSAMELIGRPNKTANQEMVAEWTLRRLARVGRTWTIHPSSNRITANNSNSNSNPSAGFVYGSNSNSNMNNGANAYLAGGSGLPTAAAAPNYSKASGAVKKWLATRPHTIHQNVVHIKFPANASDPVAFHNFAPGNEAVMVIKKRLQPNGAMRSKRTFYTKKTIGSMAASHRRIAAPHNNPVSWRTILRMKGSDVVFKDPINRRAVYRRDLMNVKFV